MNMKRTELATDVKRNIAWGRWDDKPGL